MPVMDGWTFREELLKDVDLAEVPVVLLSARDGLEKEAVALAAADYLRKPIDFDRLYRVVETHC